MNAMRRAVLFDLDGTLVDSVPDLCAAVNQALAGLGRAPLSEEEVRGYVGDGARVLLARALDRSMVGHEDPAQVDQAWHPFMAAYEAQLCVRSQLYPGVAETLRGLHGEGYRLGVVTNKPARFVAPLLEHLGVLDCFEVCVGGDSLPQRKPDPAPLVHAMAALEVSGQRPITTLGVDLIISTGGRCGARGHCPGSARYHLLAWNSSVWAAIHQSHLAGISNLRRESPDNRHPDDHVPHLRPLPPFLPPPLPDGSGRLLVFLSPWLLLQLPLPFQNHPMSPLNGCVPSAAAVPAILNPVDLPLPAGYSTCWNQCRAASAGGVIPSLACPPAA